LVDFFAAGFFDGFFLAGFLLAAFLPPFSFCETWICVNKEAVERERRKEREKVRKGGREEGREGRRKLHSSNLGFCFITRFIIG
jgi:hypothetical protein